MDDVADTTAEQTIRKLLEDRARALTQGDAEGAVRALAPEVVLFDIAPPLQQRGPETTSPDGVRQWLATFEGPIDMSVHQLHVVSDGDLAYARSFLRLIATKKGAKEQTLWMRATAVLTRTNGRWSIVHEHTSVPMLMDGSGLAAVELTPDSA